MTDLTARVLGRLFVPSDQTPIPMRLRAGLAGTKLTLLPNLSATSGTSNRQRLFLSDFHGYMMRAYFVASWSILTSTRNSQSPDACEIKVA